MRGKPALAKRRDQRLDWAKWLGARHARDDIRDCLAVKRRDAPGGLGAYLLCLYFRPVDRDMQRPGDLTKVRLAGACGTQQAAEPVRPASFRAKEVARKDGSLQHGKPRRREI